MGTGAKVGIGCAIIVALLVILMIIASIMFGDELKSFAEEAQTNPTRATATMMVSASRGGMELVAEDDVNKRYTVKDADSGELTTIFWNEETGGPEVVKGDFSAIPSGTPGVDPAAGNEVVPEAVAPE